MDTLTELNYFNDARVRAERSGRWWSSFDSDTMKAKGKVFDCDIEDEVEFEVEFEFEKCPVCNGRGKHVNPSIDCDGLTHEDFYEDPDFARDYTSGVFDVTCRLCQGWRVVPVCKDDKVQKLLDDAAQAQYEYDAERAAEMRMGA